VKRALLIAAGAAAAALFAAGCSSITPSVGQYAIGTGHGAFSNQQVLTVVPPGGHVKINGVTAWYIPAQYRNFVTGPNCHASDRCDPQTVLTRAGTGSLKGQPGMPVKVWSFVGFTVNPAIELQHMNGFRMKYPFANAFFPFCLKYACASLQAQNNDSNASNLRSSDPGWLSMADEVFPHAIDNATQTALKNFGPSLWYDKSQYPALGKAIEANIQSELGQMSNSPAGLPYFCGPGSTRQKCTPPLVIINNVTPTDPQVIASYNRQLSTAYAVQSAKARYNLAVTLYGRVDAGWFTGMNDLVNQCSQSHVTCNIYAGNAPLHP